MDDELKMFWSCGILIAVIFITVAVTHLALEHVQKMRKYEVAEKAVEKGLSINFNLEE